MPPDSNRRQDRLSRIKNRLKEISRQRYGCNAEPESLTDKGLAHDHFTLPDTEWLFRVPKQSQMSLSPQDNLHYQSACFSRAEPSGSTPAFRDIIEPDDDLPFGALVVQHIRGRSVKLPQDLRAIAGCLATIHSLPLPDVFAPLLSYSNPLKGILSEISQQAKWLDHPSVSPQSAAMIREEITAAQADIEMEDKALCLITFDAHPGNYIIQEDGKAIIVDLEKMRYATAGLDLAHATLYTSTTWDIEAGGEVSLPEVASAYAVWLNHVPREFSGKARTGLLAERRVMWLWSVTWCAKWRAQSVDSYKSSTTQDWSRNLSEDDLTRHVADRADCYLQPEIIQFIRREWREDNELTALLR